MQPKFWMISRSLRRWVALAAFGLLGPAACELNPQPDLPGSNAVHDPGVPAPGGPVGMGGNRNMEGSGNTGGTVPVITAGTGSDMGGSPTNMPGGGSSAAGAGPEPSAGGEGNGNAAGAGGNDAGGESAGGFASAP
jgi:hypothetical protein